MDDSIYDKTNVWNGLGNKFDVPEHPEYEDRILAM